MTKAFIHGFVLAFGLILPLGVQNVFVFHQGARQRRFVAALPAVVTASLCDTLLIALAVYGTALVVWGSFWVKTVLMAGGVLFLAYMGWVTWNSPPVRAGEGEAFPVRKQIAFAASVSLLNPHAILDTAGVIGTSSLQYDGAEKAAFALACILVSWLWFAGLAMAGRVTGRLDSTGRLLGLLNKGSALVMWGAAVAIARSMLP